MASSLTERWWRLPKWVQALAGAYLPPQAVGQRVFYLTFDDGPSGPLTVELVDLLEAWGWRATFFWVWSAYQETWGALLAQKLRAGGHAVGLHGEEHLSPWRLPRRLRQEGLKRAWRCWEKVGVPLVSYYRPPYGHGWGWAALPGFRWVLWDLMPLDYLPNPSWPDRLLRQLRPGDVVVLHERRYNLTAWGRFFRMAAYEGWRAIGLPPVEGAPQKGSSLSAG
ncbi:MAG: hypothetical protein D6750_05715 [Bacteroidetes bacterium]|nr:MAG: hypothetical protein D6750_05715 [Bacteroidota bacterium]